MRSVSLASNTPRVGQLTLVSVLALLTTLATTVNAQVSVTCPPDMTVPNDPGVCSAVVEFPAPIVTGTNATDVVTVTPPSGSTFPVGTNEVLVSVTDGGTNLAHCSFRVIVEDTEPPVIANVYVRKAILWPPNHKLVCITVKYDAIDNCDSEVTSALTVTSNEPPNGKGDGNTSEDWQVIDAHRVKLRAERSGLGCGRVYTITITATDSSGNSASTDVSVVVPHDRGKGHGHGNGNGNGKKPCT